MKETIDNYNKSELEMIFNNKQTENGDDAFNSTGNKLVDIMFMAEYYSKHLDNVHIGTSDTEKLFSMFMRDPRYGLGYKDLGRKLMYESGCTLQEVVKAGSFKDLRSFSGFYDDMYDDFQKFMKSEIEKGNELAKKWCPRYSSKHLMLARQLAKSWGMNKQTYGKFVKCTTIENKLSLKNTADIDFSKIPSLALIKYYDRFLKGEDTSKSFAKYLDNVKEGTAKMNIATSTVYDIFKNVNKIDADLFFDKIEKIKINCIPILDTSGSMWDSNDSIRKAMSIGHYLAKCSTYCPNQVISFSSQPELITLGDAERVSDLKYYANQIFHKEVDIEKSQYIKEIVSMYTGDCSNTNLKAVFDLLSNIKTEVPEYLVVLSDMEFDQGSQYSKESTMNMFKERNFNTKIIWWNFNSRNTTAPETDEYGNIFLSGYNPMLLNLLETGFDSKKFLAKLLSDYKEKISK